MTRRKYIARLGGLDRAIEHEQSCLSIGEPYLPVHALRVLGGGRATPRYWSWLARMAGGR